jgi:hypothetical protein
MYHRTPVGSNIIFVGRNALQTFCTKWKQFVTAVKKPCEKMATQVSLMQKEKSPFHINYRGKH